MLHKFTLTFTFILITLLSAFTQDSLTIEALKEFTTHFKIENKKLDRAGADFWRKEFRDNQFVLLGKYHHSPRISEFTAAVIPLFKESGGNFFGLEVGPTSAEILQELSADPAQARNNLRELNSVYAHTYSGGVYAPIPFFANVSDADFLAAAAREKLTFLGLDRRPFTEVCFCKKHTLKINLSRKTDTLK